MKFALQICKKISGLGAKTAQWCTNVGNEYSQILTCVLTASELIDHLKPMANGLMDR